MTREDLIKQAYAHGASVALHELGYTQEQAQVSGMKLAEDQLIEKTAINVAELKALLGGLPGKARGMMGAAGEGISGAAGRAGGAVSGAAGQAGEAIGGAAGRAGGALGGAAETVGREAAGAGRTVGATAEDLIAALRGQPFPGAGSLASPRTTRTARGALGAGLLGGAGLGAGGMAMAD